MRVFRSPEDALAYFTECQLATVEGLRFLKRPQGLKRHEDIAARMVQACIDFKVDACSLHQCPRLETKLKAGERK